MKSCTKIHMKSCTKFIWNHAQKSYEIMHKSHMKSCTKFNEKALTVNFQHPRGRQPRTEPIGQGEPGTVHNLIGMSAIGLICVHNFCNQLSRSSRAIQWGAYFSVVCGWKYIPFSASEPYDHQECDGLLVFHPRATLFLLPLLRRPFQEDLFRSRSRSRSN